MQGYVKYLCARNIFRTIFSFFFIKSKLGNGKNNFVFKCQFYRKVVYNVTSYACQALLKFFFVKLKTKWSGYGYM